MTIDLARARKDVIYFAEIAGRPVADWQAPALALEKKATVIVAPRQTGKSRSLSVLAVWWAFRRAKQRVLLISAGETTAKRLLGEVSGLVHDSPLLRGSQVDDQSLLATFTNGSEIECVPASERQIRSRSVDLLIVDEAAYVDEDLLLSAAIPTTNARENAKIVLASSPGAASGAFYRFAQDGFGDSEFVDAFTWRLIDASWIGRDVIEMNRRHLAPAAFEREVMGEFADVGADERVIERGWIDTAREISLQAGDQVVYGLDVARQGADESVLVQVRLGRGRQVVDEDGVFVDRRDLVARVVWGVREPDLMQLANRVRASVGSASVWVDAAGLGYGVVDRLREHRVNAVEFSAASRASDPRRHLNLRAQAWWHAREMFRDGMVDLEDEMLLADQLAAVKYRLAPNGALQIESKDRLTKSPDRADAAVIALWGARMSLDDGLRRPMILRPHSLLTNWPGGLAPSLALRLWDGAGPGITTIDEESVSGLSPAEDLARLRSEPVEDEFLRRQW